MSGNDVVNHPDHYTAGGIETIDYLRAKMSRERFLGYLQGNALKYLSRLGKKGNEDDESLDVLKAQWYVQRLALESKAKEATP